MKVAIESNLKGKAALNESLEKSRMNDIYESDRILDNKPKYNTFKQDFKGLSGYIEESGDMLMNTPPDAGFEEHRKKFNIFKTADLDQSGYGVHRRDSRNYSKKNVSSLDSEKEREFNDLKQMVKAPKISYIYKQQNDLTAAFLYALGCSLIHAVFFGMSFNIKMPDHEVAEKFDQEFIGNLTQTMQVLGKSIDDLDPMVLTLCQDSAE